MDFTSMPITNKYHELNYLDNSLHYRDFSTGGKYEAMAKTWLKTDTVDAWRHHRMYHLLDPLLEEVNSKWLSVGDGRYGKDARYIAEKGGDVTASDIDDRLLKEAQDLGFIKSFSQENAESLSFEDSTFHYVLCKEAYHHFPRPMIALYEMLRVASEAVVLIEPNDQYIAYGLCRNLIGQIGNKLLSFINKHTRSHNFEEFGNYIYTISRREIEKVALGLNLTFLAFKGINDCYIQGVEFESISENGKLLRKLKLKIFLFDLLTKLRIIDHGMLVAILFKQKPSESLCRRLENNGFEIVILPENPHAHGIKR